VERWNTETDVANKVPIGLNLGGVKAEAVLLEMCLNFVHERVALLLREDARQKFHDPSIAIQSSERWSIRIAPMAKE
jgi:hypothetical protein